MNPETLYLFPNPLFCLSLDITSSGRVLSSGLIRRSSVDVGERLVRGEE